MREGDASSARVAHFTDPGECRRMKNKPYILIFSASSEGGVAEHTFYQARALMEAGAKVLVLAPPSFLAGRPCVFPVERCLPDPISGPSDLVKKVRMVMRIVRSRYILAWKIIRNRPDLILLDCFVEYMAPLWADPHIFLSRILGFRYAANLHDPVRDFRIGPIWWHRLSVWLAYQFLDAGLVHHELEDPTVVPRRVHVVVTPHGLYDANSESFDRDRIRDDWGVPEGYKVFLSFGYIRDGKNLDLVIRSLPDVPDAFLVVAGSVASGHDRPMKFYRELAQSVGVADRCKFDEGYLANARIGGYFAAADYILLTYSAAFRSQSGVLNLAAKARRPVLASASQSPLMESVMKYSLGAAVEPDSQEAVANGMRELIKGNVSAPDWTGYENSASWTINAKVILSLI